MARAGGDAYSNGHQFFICFVDTTLPTDAAGGYTVVGTVTSGLDQLKSQIVAGGITPGASGATTASARHPDRHHGVHPEVRARTAAHRAAHPRAPRGSPRVHAPFGARGVQ